MSSESQRSDERTDEGEPAHLLPLESAADVGRSNWARVQFDQHIGDILQEHARGRAPSGTDTPDRDYRNHLLGVASEVAVATWRAGRIDKRIFPDYEGDDGIDVLAPSKWGEGLDRFQVKATRELQNPERVVPRRELAQCEFFVLCCSNAPAKHVEIVGYVHRDTLQQIGTAYGRDGYLLTPEVLFPIKPELHTAEDVRNVMHG